MLPVMERVRPVVKVRRLDAKAVLPAYQTEGASGMDVQACLSAPVELPPLGKARLPTALAFEIPEGFEVQVRPRSGLAARHGVTVLNAPGTIDSDYRGELCVILVNLGAEPYTVRDGDRIAQLVVAPVCRADLEEAASLHESERGSGGFGSTGV